MDRFWQKVEKTDGCWNWTSCKTVKGYGSFSVNNRMKRAHRLSFEMHKGPIPKGMLVLHSCDNPGCVRPDHLFLGTNADNMADKVAKGRQAHFCPGRGEDSPTARLTAKQVLEIRSATEPRRVLSARFNISMSQISAIKNGRAWAHLGRE